MLGLPPQLTVNHVVVSTTAHQMRPQQSAAWKVITKSGQKWKWPSFQKWWRNTFSDNTSVSGLEPFGMFYPPTLCTGLLHDSPELSTMCLTLIRACQLEWASVSLIAHSQMSKCSLCSPSGVARACPTRCFNNVHSSPNFKWIWYSVSELKTIERCVS